MYCNLTTDLRDVFPKIEYYQGMKIIEEFVSVSGQDKTYMATGAGYVEQVFDDGEQLTAKTSIADVQSNAGSYYYVADTDLLYIHAKDSDDLTASSIPDIESGVDWDAFKIRMNYDAEEEIDSYMTRLYIVPLQPRLIKRHSSNDYESPIKLASAYLTCRNIVRRLSPDDKIAQSLEKIVFNANLEDGEEKGIINKLLDGDMILQDQISPNEVGSVGNVDADSGNDGGGYIWVSGNYTGARYERWRLEIDTAGAPGTATYKLSYDTGANWDKTLQETFNADTNYRRMAVAKGIEIIFYGTFVLEDKWDFELFPSTDKPDRQKISSSTLVRE